MSTPRDRITLPEIPSTKTRLATATDERKSSGCTTQMHKTKPVYIAKKIHHEELFGETSKLGLSQINEENIAETDEFDLMEDESKGEAKVEIRNIFQQDTLISSKYKEHGKGPSYNNSGQIVKHSIIGSADAFERYQKSLKTKHAKDSGASFDKDNLSTSEKSTIKPLSSFMMGSGDQTPTTSYGRLTTQSGLFKNSEKKEKNRKDIRVSREDIMMRVQKLREVENSFYNQEAQKYLSLTLGDKLHHTKEERCLDKFDETISTWKNTVDNLNQAVKRTIGRSVMLGEEDFREKIEQAEAFDIVQTDQERFGTTYWYMTLRKYGEDADKGVQRVIKDIPEGFNSPQIIRPASSVEIIKKPVKLVKSAVVLPSINDSRYLERTMNEYLTAKSAGLHSELTKVKPAAVADLDGLMIEGKNKLESEVEAFFNVNKNKETYSVPKVFFEDRKITDDSEFLAINYEAKEVIKNGLTAYVQ